MSTTSVPLVIPEGAGLAPAAPAAPATPAPAAPAAPPAAPAAEIPTVEDFAVIAPDPPAVPPAAAPPATPPAAPVATDAGAAKALADIQSTLAELAARPPAPPAAPAAPPAPVVPPEPPAHLKALMEHEDPAIALFAQQTWADQQKQAAETGELRAKVEKQESDARDTQIANEVLATATKYGLSEAEVSKVVDFLVEVPGRAQVLSFEQGAQLTFPGRAVRATAPAPSPAATPAPTAPAGSPPGGAATIIDRSAAAGTVPAPHAVPRGLSMEQTIAIGVQKLGTR